jgi:hypothetical protein
VSTRANARQVLEHASARGARQVASQLLAETCVKLGVVGKIFDGQPNDWNAAAPPLEITVAVVRAPKNCSMVWAVYLDHEGTTAPCD